MWTLFACAPPLPLPQGLHVVRGVAWDAPDLVQGTGDGRLVLRDRRTLAVFEELEVPAPVAAVGDGPLVALVDGRVLRLGPDGLVHLATLPAPAAWIGSDAVRGWAVYRDADDWFARPLDRAESWPLPCALAMGDPGGYRIVDGRLWVAWDAGEWGGSFGELRASGTHSACDNPFVGMLTNANWLGFTDDGYVFGGDDYVCPAAMVDRVDDGWNSRWHVLVFNSAQCPLDLTGPPNPNLPAGRLTLAVDAGSERIAVVDSDLWRVSRDWMRWTRWREVHLDSPATDAHLEDDGTLILATAQDGLVAVRPDGTERRTAPIRSPRR